MKKRYNKNIVLIALLVVVVGSIYYLNSMKAKHNAAEENKNISIGLAEASEKKENRYHPFT